MPTNPDFRDLLSALNAEGVEYLVVGAHAVIFYAHPRYTKDLDLWVNPTAENAERTYRALKAFGAPLVGITASSFADPDLVYQIGVVPNRIDITMGIEGVDFPSAWPNRVESTYGDVPINIIGRIELIKNKKAMGRAQDLLDLQHLEAD